MSAVPLIVARGEPWEAGLEYGRSCRSLIKRFVEFSVSGLAERASERGSDILLQASHFLRVVDTQAPDLGAEIRGIAEGARCSVNEVMLLHVRSLLLDGLIEGGCTSFGAMAPATRGGQTFLGQNDDWTPELEDMRIVLRREPVNGPVVLTYCYAGTVGQKGLNSSGLGLCANLVVGPKRQVGLPNYVVARLLLGQDSISAATRTLSSLRRASSINFILADSGGIVDVETTTDETATLKPADGILVHANHYQDPHLASLGTIPVELEESPDRQCRMEELLSPKAGDLTLQDFKSVLADHAGYPSSICRHETQSPNSLKSIAGIVVELDRRQLHVSMGSPCSTDFNAYALDGD